MSAMEGFRRILLATDGSEQAAAAAVVAASIAMRAHSSVKVVHVWNLEVHHRHGFWDLEVHSEARRLVDTVVSRMRLVGVEAEGEILRADTNRVAAAIAAEAKSFGAQLVVVGSRGLSDWQAILQHSVSHQLLAKLDCPLLVVRGRSERSGAPRRLLLAVAGGDDVAPAVEAAVAVAPPNSTALVLHVALAIFGAQGWGYVEPEHEASATVARAVSALEAAGISASGMVAHADRVGEVVANAASEWNADLVVVGSSRPGDVASLIFGSVSHYLLHATKRPVLIAERNQW